MTNPTTYARPATLDEALALTREHRAIALAGGALSFGRLDLPHEAVVDLAGIAALRRIEATADGLVLGAAVYLSELLDSEVVPRALTRGIARVLPPNLRNRASVGETLLLDAPPAEWLAALAVLEAYVAHVGPDASDRFMEPVTSYIHSPGRFDKQTIITHVLIPPVPARAATSAACVARTPADHPIVNAAALVSLDDGARVRRALVALCGASPEPVRLLELETMIGQPLDEEAIATAVDGVPGKVNPVPDYLGSVAYRRAMAGVLSRRALRDCLELLR